MQDSATISWIGPAAGAPEELIGLGIALCLGLLVGLQREWADAKPLGLRTLGLIALFGGLCGLFTMRGLLWAVPAGLVALGLLLGFRIRNTRKGGITTVITGPVVFLVGAAASSGLWGVAVVVTGAVTLLLQWKRPLHRWVDRLSREDLEIIARFVLITLVILPVLPDRGFGPFEAINPFRTWLLVVLIVGINLVGYLLLRLVQSGAGAWLAGVLGGLISSTATTVSYAHLSRRGQRLGAPAALVVLVASAVVYPRILIELSVVSPGLLGQAAGPAIVLALVLLVLAGLVHWRSQGQLDEALPTAGNPAGLKMAVSFAGLYLLLLLVVSAARQHLGTEALYGVALLSGLMDVDALTLSLGQLHADGNLAGDTAWRAIFMASLSNLGFKIAAAAALGSPSLRRWILRTGLTALAAGLALVVLWP